jgi:hypothetical protein
MGTVGRPNPAERASDRRRLGHLVRGLVLVAIGAVLVAAGVGLLPHLIRIGLDVTSVLSVILMVGGIAAVITGARTALEGRHLPGKVGGSLATVVVVVVAVSVIGPAVAATNVPGTELGRTEGFDRAPGDWQERVVGFLDEHLS